MTQETSTIEVTKEQKRFLDRVKRSGSESYKDALQEIINSYNTEVNELDETRVRQIAVEEINERVTHRALE